MLIFISSLKDLSCCFPSYFYLGWWFDQMGQSKGWILCWHWYSRRLSKCFLILPLFFFWLLLLHRLVWYGETSIIVIQALSNLSGFGKCSTWVWDFLVLKKKNNSFNHPLLKNIHIDCNLECIWIKTYLREKKKSYGCQLSISCMSLSLCAMQLQFKCVSYALESFVFKCVHFTPSISVFLFDWYYSLLYIAF